MSVTMRISGFLDGLQVIDRRLAAIESRVADVSPAYPAVEKVFNEIARRTFESEGVSSAAGAWAPLAPSTERDRLRKGYGAAHPILVRTGDLKSSVVGRTGDTIIVSTPKYFAIGTADPKAKFHQSRRPRKKLPRRPIFEPTQDDKHDLVRPIRRYVTGHDPDAPVVGVVRR
jgi:phage gpG-like protein